MISTATQFLQHIINTLSIQTAMQTRLMTGEALETVVMRTAHDLGYAVTWDNLSDALMHNPALADKIMALLPAPMLELDETQLEMIAGGATVGTCSGGLSCVPGGGK
jgi:hypothetical protein